MKYCIILVVLALLPSLLGAQADSQQSLPQAPSATKYPPPGPQPQVQTAPPAQASPASSGTGTPSGAPPQSSAPVQTNPPTGAAKSAIPGGAATAAGTSADPRNNASDDEPLTTIRKQVDEVNVVFTVTDKRGKFVKDLTQNDFQVLDDKKPPQSIRYFSRETNLPLRVGLLIDASNSVRDRFKFEQDAAIEFLNQIIRPRFDKAFVIGFDTTPEVTQDFTDDTEQLSKGVRMLRPGGGTALYDAVYYACRDKLMLYDKGTIATRRAIILLSDGEDNQSRVTREEAVEMAQRAEVIIYTISTNTSGLKLRGDKILEHFADETGGRAFFPFKIQEVADAFSQIQDELRSQYSLSYKPAALQPNGEFHSIAIVADNKKYRVRARKGYYAPRQ
jgi:Ca-activated chloride channel family protein